MQFSFCSTPFLPGFLLEKKASLACTQSSTTSPSLPGRQILCIPSYRDIDLVASYSEVRTVLGVSCGLDQLSHHISIGTVHATPVHRQDENSSTGLYVLPHRRNYIPSFNFHGSHPPLLTNTHFKTDSPVSYTSGKHK